MAKRNRAKTRRGEETRKRILKVTRALVTESDPRRVTLDQIAEATEVAKSSLLWHFGSKEELLLEVFDNVIRDFEETTSVGLPEDLPTGEKIRLFLVGSAAFMKANPELAGVFFSYLFASEPDSPVWEKAQGMYERYRVAIVAHLASVPADIRRPLAAGLVGLVDGVFIQRYLDPEAPEPSAVFEAILTGLSAVA